MIKLSNVTKKYVSGNTTIRALDIDEFEIKRGEFISLVGPSGSGKSTFLNIIGLVDSPSSGKVDIDSKNIQDLKSNDLCLIRRDTIGFVFQSFNLLPHLNALENVMLPLIPYKVNFNLREKAEEYLTQVGLKNRLSHLPSQLSGGEQQRVAIARALINNPKVIIADEPTGNLDTTARDEIMGILKGLNNKGLTIALATHDLEIAQMANRILYLRDGRIRKVEVMNHA